MELQCIGIAAVDNIDPLEEKITSIGALVT